MKKRTVVFAAAAILLACCSERREPEAAAATHPRTAARGMTIASSAFANNGAMPQKYGCSGAAVSPPLTFAGIPSGAKSLALIVDDPDAPGGQFTHWVVWNIAPSVTSVPEGKPPAGAEEGTSSYDKIGWGPPCPPNGEHRYIFTLYAVDTTLKLPPSTGREQLQNAVNGHTLAESQLVGTYRK